MSEKIDLVLPWVDGNDSNWRRERDKYLSKKPIDETRYEPWDNLQYIFRAIEENMSWINKIFFVTWGHLPDWLNTKCEKLCIVKHEDYIPEQYLPTFNSNVIELNYFRIKDLSENFILFNDDLIPLQSMPMTYYFKDGFPCEEAVETHFLLKESENKEVSHWWNYSNVNNMIIINKHFNKLTVIKENYAKWFNPIYGERLKQNLSMYYWHNFESFVYSHEAAPMKKTVLKEIWEKEYETLDYACHNRFRDSSDVTHRLATMWQICSGQFTPHKFEGKFFLVEKEKVDEIVNAIKKKKYPIICLNERTEDSFEFIKQEINAALQEVYPQKSSFEL